MNEHQAHAYAIARLVWDSATDADTFMNRTHSMLQGRTPLEVSVTEAGARQVEEILKKLYWGLPR